MLCRPLPQTQLDSIIARRETFDKTVEELRSVLQTHDYNYFNSYFKTFLIHQGQDPKFPTLRVITLPFSPATLKVTLWVVPMMAIVIAKSGYLVQYLVITKF